MLDWIASNKEWIFEGVGVDAIVALGSWIFARRRASGEPVNQRINQKQRGGRGSTNIQVGRMDGDR